MDDDLATITKNYWVAAQRIGRRPVPAADKLVVLADVEVIYRWERAAALPQLDLDPVFFQSK
jgi:hypothetical protein